MVSCFVSVLLWLGPGRRPGFLLLAGDATHFQHVNNLIGFDLSFPPEYLRAALTISFLSVWVLVGLFYYLNRYTRRRYFSIWASAWLFYALWLTLHISFPTPAPSPWLQFLEQGCLGITAVFLLWGSARFLGLRVRQFQLALFMGFLLVWSYAGAYLLNHPLQAQVPIFTLIGLASLLTAIAFYRYRRRREFVGAGLLVAGFVLWALHLIASPFLQASEHLISTGFILSAVLQLFIAVSMIILVLEEVRCSNQATLERLQQQRSQTHLFRLQADLSEERCRVLFEQATEGIVIAAADDLSILQWNRPARRMLGLDGTPDIRALLLDYFPEVTTREPADWFATVCAQRRFRIRRPDQLTLPVEVDGTTVRFEGRDAYQFFLRELTEYTRLERRLRDAEQLAAVGRLASAVTREFSRPLHTLQTSLNALRRDLDLPVRTRQELERLAATADRTSRLAGRLLALSHRRPLHRTPTQINLLLRQLLDARLFDLRSARVQPEEVFQDGLPLVSADPELLRQAIEGLLTLLVMPLVDAPIPHRLRMTTSHADGAVRVTLETDGPKLPPELVASLADPFFAPVEPGEMTGLSCLAAHSLVAEHEGTLRVLHSTLGGTALRLDLPIQVEETKTATHAIHSAPEPARPARPEIPRILVLDDDASIASLLGEMLGLLGYRSVIRINGISALEYLGKEPVDLIICDFWMPDMDGPTFFAELQKRYPDLTGRVVFLTGDAQGPGVKELVQKSGNPALAKPFHLEAIRRIVGDTLNRGFPEVPAVA